MKKKSIYYILSFILLIGVVGIGVGIAYKVTNGFATNASFIITNSETQLVKNGGVEKVQFGTANSFFISGLNQTGFSVSVFANNNYYFNLNGAKTSFNTINYSLNSYFDVSVNEFNFTITPKYYAEDIVKGIYEEAVIDSSLAKNSDYFVVRVSYGDELYSFKLVYDTPIGIEFGQEGVEF